MFMRQLTYLIAPWGTEPGGCGGIAALPAQPGYAEPQQMAAGFAAASGDGAHQSEKRRILTRFQRMAT
jgi:hypothetical protein